MLTNLWTHIKPTFHQMLGYLVLAAILVFSSYYQELSRSIVQDNDETGLIGFIKARVGGYVELLQGNGIFDAVTFFMIIVGIGALIYLAIWLTMNFLSEFVQNLELTISYVHPKEYYEVNHWVHAGAMFLLQIIGLIALAGYSLFWLDAVVPSVEERIREFFDNSGAESIIGALGSLMLLIISFHIFTLILRTIFHTYPDKVTE